MGNDEHHALYELLGDRIRTAREKARLSKTKLAMKLGLHRVSIVNIEKGTQHPPLHVLWRLAEAVGVELVELIPCRSDFDAAADGMQLDADSIQHLELATKGDIHARRTLEAFIKKAREGKKR